MSPVLAFDVYGTLIDTAGVLTELRSLVGSRADDFSRMWRDKQLEYSFRRGLMGCYEDFSVCVGDALDYTALSLRIELTDGDRQALLAAYRHLPAFPDAESSLGMLSSAGFSLYAFSNGAGSTVRALLDGAGIGTYFRDIVSVEDQRSFKPDPAVYRHFLRRAGVEAQAAWLVSGNSFDVIGAMSAGMRGIWVRRSPDVVFDPWGVEPTLSVAGLDEICSRLSAT
jgi:2-haloacid dehalogenase